PQPFCVGSDCTAPESTIHFASKPQAKPCRVVTLADNGEPSFTGGKLRASLISLLWTRSGGRGTQISRNHFIKDTWLATVKPGASRTSLQIKHLDLTSNDGLVLFHP